MCGSGIQVLKPDLIKQAIIKNPRKQKEILGWVQKANEQAKIEAECYQAINELGGKLRDSSREAYLDVKETAFSRVKVRIGNQEKTLEEDVKASRFELDKSGQTRSIVWKALTDIGKEETSEE